MDTDTILQRQNNYRAGEAITSVKIKSDMIEVSKYGATISYKGKISKGNKYVRYWRFESKKGYFRFIADYWDHLVGVES